MHDELVARAAALLDMNRPHDALEVLAPALAMDWPPAHLVAGRCRLVLDDADAAWEHGQRAQSGQPEGADGLALMCLADLAAERRERARAEGAEATARDPINLFALQAYAYSLMDDPATTMMARQVAARALQLEPGDPDLLVLNARAHLYTGGVGNQWDKGRARAYLEAALAVDPTHDGARHGLAVLDSLEGRSGLAIGRLTDVLRGAPTNEGARSSLGHVLSGVLLVLRIGLGVVAAVILLGTDPGNPATIGFSRGLGVVAALVAGGVLLSRLLRMGMPLPTAWAASTSAPGVRLRAYAVLAALVLVLGAGWLPLLGLRAASVLAIGLLVAPALAARRT